MGKDWEDHQRDLLVAKQQIRIDKLKAEFLKKETKIAKEQAFEETAQISSSSQKKSVN